MKCTVLWLLLLTALPVSPKAQTQLVRVVDTTCVFYPVWSADSITGHITAIDTTICFVDTADAWAIVPRVDTVIVHDTVYVPIEKSEWIHFKIPQSLLEEWYLRSKE